MKTVTALAVAMGLAATPSAAAKFCYPPETGISITVTDNGYVWSQPGLAWNCTWIKSSKQTKALCIGSGEKSGQVMEDDMRIEIDADTLWLTDDTVDLSSMTRCG